MFIEVVGTVIRGTVYNVCDPVFLQDLTVLRDVIASKEQEVVYDLRANFLVVLVFILFARSSLHVKIFV